MYKQLAKYVVKKDEYLGLNLEQAEYVVDLVLSGMEKELSKKVKKLNKQISNLDKEKKEYSKGNK